VQDGDEDGGTLARKNRNNEDEEDRDLPGDPTEKKTSWDIPCPRPVP